jgi:hypothetical protein
MHQYVLRARSVPGQGQGVPGAQLFEHDYGTGARARRSARSFARAFTNRALTGSS